MDSAILNNRLQVAAQYLQAGRAAEVVEALRDLATEAPQAPDAWRLFGIALKDTGDLSAASDALGRALQLAPRFAPTAVALCEVLVAQAQPVDAIAVVEPFARPADADIHVLTAWGDALKANGDLEGAISAYERGVRVAPQSAVAEHNLASALGDSERYPESEAVARRAFAKGLDAPETWLVLARALLGQNKLVEAENAYREAVTRRPDYVEAHGELAQLIWMRAEDTREASLALDEAILAFPDSQALKLKKAELLEYAGDMEGAFRAIAPAVDGEGGEAAMHVAAARLLADRDPDRAFYHARLATRLAPDDVLSLRGLCLAHLARGEARAAETIAAELHERAPWDQHALALLATAWRLAGDDRYRALHDYDALVGVQTIDTPAGWPSLEAYLGDLKASLDRLHTFRTHPLGQSLRHGSQTAGSLTLSADPVIRAFFKAIDGPIRRHIAGLGRGGDVVRSRSTGEYRFNGVWSVRLRPQGFHADHVHPMGWYSSACYVELPQSVESGREGWLKFGEPGVVTKPALAPDHFIKPAPGLLALFPSYMWHGTVPFSGDESRMTIAFDIVPA